MGHVEWVTFLRAARVPRPGDVVGARELPARAAGGGAVAAAVLAELGAEVDLFCALGDDEQARDASAQLNARGVAVHAARRRSPTRRALAILDELGERTIVTLGARLAPRGEDDLAWERLTGADGAYLTAGDAAACLRARAAGVLVATPRVREGVTAEGPALDALVFSGADEAEARWARRLRGITRLMVETQGADGGRWWGESSGRWRACVPPRRPHDSYGCGDAFAAAFTYGLATGCSVPDAASLGAQWGAKMLERIGAP